MPRANLDAIFATPAPPPLHKTRKQELSAKWVKELVDHGIPAPLATQLARTAKGRADLEDIKARWTGRCAMTGKPFTDGNGAAVLRHDGEFVMAMIARAQGGLPDTVFIQMCRAVINHCAPPTPLPQVSRHPAQPTPPHPIAKDPPHANHFDLGTALGVHHQDIRPQELDQPLHSPGAAEHGKGVWTWDATLGRPVCRPE